MTARPNRTETCCTGRGATARPGASLRRTWREDRWVKPFFGQYRKALALALALGLAAFLFAAALMFTSGYLIGGAAEMPASVLLLNVPLMAVRIFGVGKPILHYCERLTSHDWVLRMTSGLRLKLYRALERDAVFLGSARRLGDVLGLLSEDIGHVQNLYLRTVFPTVIAWLLAVVVIVGLGALTPWAALALLLVLGVDVVLVPLVSVLVNGALQTRGKLLKNELYASLADNVMGVSDWVFSGRANDYQARHVEAQRELRRLRDEAHRFDRKRDVVVQAMFALGAVIVLAWAAGRFAVEGHGGSGNWIIAFVLGYFPLIDAFAPLSAAAVEAQAHEDSIRRLNELDATAGRDGTSAARIPHAPLDVVVRDVAFSYEGGSKRVLSGIDLTLQAGEHVAVLGASGSGKSTLASLVRGDLAPTRGTVTVGGVPTCELGDAASRYFGVVQQSTYLFNATLRDNLRLACPDAEDARLEDALRRVGLDGLLERLGEGLDTMVDEAGLRFSGGERHRIALARVLLQDAPIVLLDEPTVSLDLVTERSVLDTLFDVFADKTLIMITHHLQGVSRMDRVVFLEEGAVKLDGAPAQLEETSELYRRLLAFDQGFHASV